jgi:hypothetical protein
MEVPNGIPFGLHWSLYLSLCKTRNGLVSRKFHQVVLSWWVAAQCFLFLYVEKLDVPYGGRMVLWLCFVASTALLFAHDIGFGMLTIILFGLHWSLISISISIPLYQTRNALVCRKLHQLVLPRRLAAQCFPLCVEKCMCRMVVGWCRGYVTLYRRLYHCTRCRYWYAIYYKRKGGGVQVHRRDNFRLVVWWQKAYLHWLCGAEASYCVGARSKTERLGWVLSRCGGALVRV